jgi:transcription-repair coupling factor (superfamily II helicase)
VIEIKLACLEAGVAKLEAGPKGGLVTFQGDRFANPEGLFAYIERLGVRAKLRPDQKLFVAADWAQDGARLKGALQLALALAKLAGGAMVKPAAKAEPAAKPLPPKPAAKLPVRPSVFKSKIRR